MSRITVFTGNYGSGKTELSLNMALKAAENELVTLVDLDIVNPYFRSTGKADMLREKGIKLFHPNFADKAVDVPSLPAEIDSVFIDKTRRVFFDVGGDPTGATALGRYYPHFLKDDYEMLFVINVRRPFMTNADDIIVMLRDIEAHSRLKVTGLINNSNLARDTRVEDLLEGQEIIQEVSERLKTPIRYVCATKEILEEFENKGAYQGEPFEMEIYMRPSWLDDTAG